MRSERRAITGTHSPAGFTLVELMVAAVILLLTISAIMTGMGMAETNRWNAVRMQEANAIAKHIKTRLHAHGETEHCPNVGPYAAGEQPQDVAMLRQLVERGEGEDNHLMLAEDHPDGFPVLYYGEQPYRVYWEVSCAQPFPAQRTVELFVFWPEFPNVDIDGNLDQWLARGRYVSLSFTQGGVR